MDIALRCLVVLQGAESWTQGSLWVQQEPFAETREGTAISINCSHANKKSYDYIQWYRQLPGRGPAFLVLSLTGTKELPDPPGQLRVAADRRSSALWLARPRLKVSDSALYLCAVRDTPVQEVSLAVQEPRRGRRYVCARLRVGEGALRCSLAALLPLYTQGSERGGAERLLCPCGALSDGSWGCVRDMIPLALHICVWAGLVHSSWVLAFLTLSLNTSTVSLDSFQVICALFILVF
uniref:Ig-like domain-containing protein n=1 Tax=Calidris pygmaea TaxID=425635 RepID=A0A8C3J8U8_9CHAR